MVTFKMLTIKLYASKCLYLISQDTTLPVGQISMVVNLTGGNESGIIHYMRIQLALSLRTALKDSRVSTQDD